MAVARSLFQSLQKYYGADKGSQVYHSMEASKSARLRKALRTAKKRGHASGLGVKKKNG